MYVSTDHSVDDGFTNMIVSNLIADIRFGMSHGMLDLFPHLLEEGFLLICKGSDRPGISLKLQGIFWFYKIE